jgi:uncharacterized protein YjbI with pentapeptide repeats
VKISIRSRDKKETLFQYEFEDGDESELIKKTIEKAVIYGAHLGGADLKFLRLQYLNLDCVRLPGADLRGSDLLGAYLRYTNLRDADLRDANLRGADLRWADLSYARLENAELEEANLHGANLTGTKLDERAIKWNVEQGIKTLVSDSDTEKLKRDARRFEFIQKHARATPAWGGGDSWEFSIRSYDLPLADAIDKAISDE